MIEYDKKTICKTKGFTLVELVIVVPFIALIFILAYNMFFLTQRSFRSVAQSYDAAEELRIFQTNIQKEANQAKKGEEAKDVLHRISQEELYIYTDVDDDNIPEIVRYRLVNKKILRDVKKAMGNEYPYSYSASSFGAAKPVLSNVVNTDIFSAQEVVKEPKSNQEAKDHRKKLKLKLVLSKEGYTENIEIQTYLVSKSRTEAE